MWEWPNMEIQIVRADISSMTLIRINKGKWALGPDEQTNWNLAKVQNTEIIISFLIAWLLVKLITSSSSQRHYRFTEFTDYGICQAGAPSFTSAKIPARNPSLSWQSSMKGKLDLLLLQYNLVGIWYSEIEQDTVSRQVKRWHEDYCNKPVQP